MRVLLVGRAEGGLIRGGAEIQLDTTRNLLSRAGHDAVILSPEVEEWGDLVHFFGLNESYWSLASLCQEKGTPYVVSSIWYEPGPAIRLRSLQLQRRIEGRFPRKSAKLLRGAARILIPSPEVAWRLATFFGADPARCAVVPSGAIDPTFINADEHAARQLFGLEGRYAVCVGNFLERKNQLGVIRALKGMNLPVVFAGGDSDREYHAKCVEDARGEPFRFLGKVPHDGGVLASLVKGASVCVMPSRLEDFLIAGVEAGSVGKPLVLGSTWNAQEIYGSHAFYAHPADIDGIRAMTVAALASGDSAERAEWFCKKYSEEAFLQRTLDAYRSALE